ncbi:MAG TPA: DUF885 domain-containing protein [Acidimicrobiales bacterium]|nr:DUF885 domain-containing protein [Acidimicrobiales bacterium]
MPDETLRNLAEEFWETVLEASPSTATLLGDHRYDDRLEDLSAGSEQQFRARWASLRDRVEAVPRGGLDADDLVTFGLLTAELDDAMASIDQRLIELQSDQMTGFHVDLLQAVPVMAAPDETSANMLVERFRQVPQALEQAAERFVAGAGAGRTPAAVCITRSVNMIEGYLKSSLDDDVFVNVGGPEGWDRTGLREVVEKEVRPAYRQMADVLKERLLPVGRDDDHCGLSWLGDDGAEIYATLVSHHTTLELPPEEIHAIGMHEVTEKLPGEYAEVGGRLFNLTDPVAVLERLRTDPALRYATGEEIMADAREAFQAAKAIMGDWFGRLPQSDCAIEQVPEFLAPDSPSAYYFPPAGDGSRGGTYYVNTHAPEDKARYETASIAFHEAIPGHHLQIAIATELTDVPSFRRFSLANTAYVEGWGLYSERLAEDMDLYRNDMERIGMLAADSIRACRLVVDTGLHALGWTRRQAIDFMAANTPVSVEEVTVEIDRYIGMPAQALAYKLGQREILRLREWSRGRLGERFDIRGFHDAVLTSGAVRLPILAELVGAWVDSVPA